MNDRIENGVVVGNYFNKYESKNPIARYLVGGFMTEVLDLVRSVAPASIHEVGCGEGFLTIEIAKLGFPIRGSDISRNMLAEAETRAAGSDLSIPFKPSPLEALERGADAAELVVCCEVLEHLTDPEVALDKLAELASPHLLCSVPREPLWRVMNMARMKYWADLGNTPGHLNHWSRRGFLSFLERRFEVLEVRAPLPWTIALCRTR